MSFLKRIGGRLPDFGDVVRRFPVAVILMAGFSLYLIINNVMNGYRQDEEYIIGAFILAGYVSVCLQLMSESRNWVIASTIGLKIGAIVTIFGLCLLAQTLNFTIPLAIAAAILFLGNASAWRRERADPQVWNFTQKLWTGAIFATVGSIIFALGILSITQALKILFGFNIRDLTTDIVLPIGLAFLAPVYWMGTLPLVKSEGKSDTPVDALSFEARALSFLGTWMLAPLLCVYAVILLAYGVKIITTWDLPKGEIASLVTPFLGVGMLVWLMLDPKVLNESAFVRFYRRVWHWVMLPAAVLLGLAVFVRVQAYGFTVERFILASISAAAIIQSAWFIFAKTKRDIRIPTAIAAAFLLMASFMALPVSIWNQMARGQAAVAVLESLGEPLEDSETSSAKILSASLKYLVKVRAYDAAEKLTPGVEVPKRTYGVSWDQYLARLGLTESIADVENRSTYFQLKAKPEALDIQSFSKLHSEFKVTLRRDGKRFGEEDARVLSTSDFTLVIRLDGVTYRGELRDSFIQMSEIVTAAEIEHAIAPLVLTSDTGSFAIFVVTAGNVSLETRGTPELRTVYLEGIILTKP